MTALDGWSGYLGVVLPSSGRVKASLRVSNRCKRLVESARKGGDEMARIWVEMKKVFAFLSADPEELI